MLTAHHIVAFLVLATTWGTAALLGWAYYRKREPRGIVTHLLALTQTLLVAQVGLGLLLLSDHRRAPERLHYLYGTLALLAVLLFLVDHDRKPLMIVFVLWYLAFLGFSTARLVLL